MSSSTSWRRSSALLPVEGRNPGDSNPFLRFEWCREPGTLITDEQSASPSYRGRRLTEAREGRGGPSQSESPLPDGAQKYTVSSDGVENFVRQAAVAVL